MTAVQRAASAGLAALVLAIGAAPAVASSHHGVPRDPRDPLDPSVCLLPFPNDYFTTRDHHTATGLRVHRDAGRGQRLQVAASGRDGHLELVGQLGRGDPATGLHEQEGGHETVGAHVTSFAKKVLS